MAKRELHSKAIEMRLKGMSYSQIKKELGVSKSTLSVWLRDFPLSENRLRELRDSSETRIEKYRETRRKTREKRWQGVLDAAANDIGMLSDRERFLSGLFLYWGEGSKTQYVTASLSNTDPAVLRFYISWLELLNVSREQLRVQLHLYSDMDVDAETRYWSETLELPLDCFRKPYIKVSRRSELTFSQKFKHGTCNILYHNRDIGEYIHMSLKHLQTQFAGKQEV